MTSLFCRHNRFTAECPICSKGTVLGRETTERAKPAKPTTSRQRSTAAKQVTATRYPHSSTGPIEHEARIYDVRLEQVPGGLRLGQWRSGELERKAPVLPISALTELFDDAQAKGYVRFDAVVPEADAASEGRAGDMKEELRLEHVGEGFVRIARWIFWPGAGVGWELQDAPVMLPEKRFEEILGTG